MKKLFILILMALTVGLNAQTVTVGAKVSISDIPDTSSASVANHFYSFNNGLWQGDAFGHYHPLMVMTIAGDTIKGISAINGKILKWTSVNFLYAYISYDTTQVMFVDSILARSSTLQLGSMAGSTVDSLAFWPNGGGIALGYLYLPAPNEILVQYGTNDDTDRWKVDEDGDEYQDGSEYIGETTAEDTQDPSLVITGDADSDASATTTEALTINLAASATPTSAMWGFTSTQGAGYNFDKPLTIGANGGISGQLNFVASDNDQWNIAANTSDQEVHTGAGGGIISYSNIDPGAADTYTLGSTAAWNSAYISDNLCVGGKAQTASIYVSQEATFANTDSSVRVWVNAGVPTISGAATDGDLSNLTWNTSDQIVLTGGDLVIATGEEFLVGSTQWSDASTDKIDGEQIADNTIDGDALDFNYVASVATSILTGLTGGAAGSEATAISLGFDRTATLAADPAIVAGGWVPSTTGIIFEGTTADGIETLVTLTDPTSADKTITLPNATGTVAVSATAPVTLSALGDVGLTIAKDLVAGVGLSGGEDNVFPAADADVTLTFAPDEVTGGTTWDDGGEASVIWTWNLSADDPAITFGANVVNISTGALQEGGIAVLNNDEMDASSELATIFDDETGTAGFVVFSVAPTLTGQVNINTSVSAIGLSIDGNKTTGNLQQWINDNDGAVGDSSAVINKLAQFVSTVPIGVSPFSITSTTVNTNLNADLLDGENASAFEDADATLADIADGTIAEDLVNTAYPWADNEVADNLTITPTTLTIGVAHTTAGDLTLLGGAAAVGPKLALYNSVDEDDTEDYWLMEPQGTNFWLGSISDADQFIFSNAGNFTAAGNVAGATYGSDASISNAELLTLDNGATTEILVGGGAGSAPVWTTAEGTGAPVRSGSPTLTTPNIGAATGTSINLSSSNAATTKIDTIKTAGGMVRWVKFTVGGVAFLAFPASDSSLFRNAI